MAVTESAFYVAPLRLGALGRLAGLGCGVFSTSEVFLWTHGICFAVRRMVARAGEAAKFGFLVHSHMLRHSCGYKLANDGQDTRAIQHYLGHRSIASTVRYTALAPDRFKGFWKD